MAMTTSQTIGARYLLMKVMMEPVYEGWNVSRSRQAEPCVLRRVA